MRLLIEKYFKCWGVLFESSLPPEFIVTSHAEDRLLTRFGCNRDKCKKITIKAWYSKEKVEQTWINKKEYFDKTNDATYKYFMGHVFIFQVIHKRDYSQKKLITLYPKKGVKSTKDYFRKLNKKNI